MIELGAEAEVEAEAEAEAEAEVGILAWIEVLEQVAVFAWVDFGV